jgi:hypothetical protein
MATNKFLADFIEMRKKLAVTTPVAASAATGDVRRAVVQQKKQKAMDMEESNGTGITFATIVEKKPNRRVVQEHFVKRIEELVEEFEGR